MSQSDENASATEARAKARNAAVALERLVEERFSDPDALGGKRVLR